MFERQYKKASELSQYAPKNALLAQLQEDASKQLALGGELSPVEQRALTNQFRAAGVARGEDAINSGASVTAETFAHYGAMRQRQLENRGYAGQMASLGMQEDQFGFSTALGGSVGGANLANIMQNLQGQQMAAGQASGAMWGQIGGLANQAYGQYQQGQQNDQMMALLAKLGGQGGQGQQKLDFSEQYKAL
jgi:hypothetical protein